MPWYRVAVQKDISPEVAADHINNEIKANTSQAELDELGSDYSFVEYVEPASPGEVAGVFTSDRAEFSRWLEDTYTPSQLGDDVDYYRIGT